MLHSEFHLPNDLKVLRKETAFVHVIWAQNLDNTEFSVSYFQKRNHYYLPDFIFKQTVKRGCLCQNAQRQGAQRQGAGRGVCSLPGTGIWEGQSEVVSLPSV